jgi:phage baseplate assembly protein W
MSAMDDSSFLGTGWSFPPVFDRASLQLQCTSGVANIAQSIELLLNTPRGSRALLPDFGCNLSQYVFRRLDAALQEEIVQSVTTTLLNDEPRIDVEKVEVSTSADGSTMLVQISYIARSTNSRHNHVIPFAMFEGSNLNLGT